jgi:hypothetical protein
MADTLRSTDYFLNASTGALKDNTAGAITPQVARDLLLSAYRPHLLTPGGRLTVETGVPISTSDRTAQSTLYYTPHLHTGLSAYELEGLHVRGSESRTIVAHVGQELRRVRL